jgi:hypothetical protein
MATTGSGPRRPTVDEGGREEARGSARPVVDQMR